MAVRIANLKILVSASTRGLVSGFSNASRSVKTFGSRISASVTSVKGLALGFAGLIGVTVGLRSAIGALQRQFTELDKLGKTASKIGVTTKALQKMRFAAKLSGVEITTTDMALQRFTRRTAEAAVGTGEAQAAFKELQINAEEFVDLPLEKQMLGLADAFKRFKGPDQLRLAFKLFDSEGAALVNTLKGGSEALDQMFKDRGDLGLFSDEQIRRIESANDNMERFGIQVNFIKGSIAAELAPTLDELVASMVAFGKEGEASFSAIGVGLEGLAKSIAFMVDGVRFITIALNALGAQLAKGVAQFLTAADILAEKVGLSVGGQQFEQDLKAFVEEIDFALKELDDAFLGPTALDRVDQFFGKVDDRIKRTREGGKGLLDIPTGTAGVKALLPQARLAGTAAAASFSAERRAKTGLSAVIAGGKERLAVLQEMADDLDELANRGPAVLEAAVL